MRAIILAAGKGTRIGAFSRPKPLIELDGKPLLQHVIETLRKSGIQELFVVTGYLAEKIEGFIDYYGQFHPEITLIPIRNEQHEKGIFSSLLKGIEANLMRMPVIVTMADHLHSPQTVQNLLNTQGNYLVVDRNPPSHVDLEEATKVILSPNGKILKLNKKIRQFQAIDTGLFRFEPNFQEAFFELKRDNPTLPVTISEAINLIVAKKSLFLHAHVINGKPWIDIDTKKDLENARHILRALH